MARLSLFLLGPFQATLDEQPITSFESVKVRALLAYLAVEADRPHRREQLAGLLWPEQPDRAALGNLRYALANLRQALGDTSAALSASHTATPPFLLVTRDTIQFNPASDHWLDVADFGLRISELQSAIRNLQSAIELYRGRFLDGFSVDSAAFEEWALLWRERIDRQVLAALQRLAALHEQRGEYEPAQAYARRQLELEPWREEAHQQLMRLLAFDGQRSAALAQYQACRRLLAEELGVAPARETTELYERIRDGLLRRGTGEQRSGGAISPAPLPPSPPALFVGRERELAKLDGLLAHARAGQGRVAFVTGEAGSGKTALVDEFVRRAMATHGDLVAAAGRGNAQAGLGDPYLPFLEVMQMLTGDVEAERASGAITPEHARRLWSVLPAVAQALVEEGPDLFDLFVPALALLRRVEAFALGGATPGAPWQAQLRELAKRTALRPFNSVPGPPAPDAAAGPGLVPQTNLFEQVTHVLRALVRQRPLLLVLDDLQWADAGSLSLLFHLGRRLAGSRILVIGAYRPGDLARGGEGDRHPLESVVHEFQRDWGDIQVDLDQAEGRPFVDAFLDTEPNRLGESFRETLYRRTGGQPLFTVELLGGLQERGDLVRDEAGRWVEGPTLDWG